MRVNHLISRARHGMQKAYDMARVAGGKLNNFIDTSARVYGGVVQPLRVPASGSRRFHRSQHREGAVLLLAGKVDG